MWASNRSRPPWLGKLWILRLWNDYNCAIGKSLNCGQRLIFIVNHCWRKFRAWICLLINGIFWDSCFKQGWNEFNNNRILGLNELCFFPNPFLIRYRMNWLLTSWSIFESQIYLLLLPSLYGGHLGDSLKRASPFDKMLFLT